MLLIILGNIFFCKEMDNLLGGKKLGPMSPLWVTVQRITGFLPISSHCIALCLLSSATSEYFYALVRGTQITEQFSQCSFSLPFITDFYKSHSGPGYSCMNFKKGHFIP